MPFKSEAQRRLFHVMEGKGEISHAKVHEWEHETKNKGSLPYHVKKAGLARPATVLGPLLGPAPLGEHHSKASMKHAIKQMQMVNSKDKRSMDETLERSFLDELQKIGKDLTESARDKIKSKNFAEPKERKYPVEDEAHARNALSRVSQFGSSEEKEKVRAKVHSKYPEMGKEKKSAGLMGALNMDTAKSLGRSAVAGASKFIRANPIKSAVGAAAAGRYLMPKNKESSAMAGAAKKLKKVSMGAYC